MLLVSELGAVDGRANKEEENWRFLPKCLFFIKIINFSLVFFVKYDTCYKTYIFGKMKVYFAFRNIK